MSENETDRNFLRYFGQMTESLSEKKLSSTECECLLNELVYETVVTYTAYKRGSTSYAI